MLADRVYGRDAVHSLPLVAEFDECAWGMPKGCLSHSESVTICDQTATFLRNLLSDVNVDLKITN